MKISRALGGKKTGYSPESWPPGLGALKSETGIIHQVKLSPLPVICLEIKYHSVRNFSNISAASF